MCTPPFKGENPPPYRSKHETYLNYFLYTFTRYNCKPFHEQMAAA